MQSFEERREEYFKASSNIIRNFLVSPVNKDKRKIAKAIVYPEDELSLKFSEALALFYTDAILLRNIFLRGFNRDLKINLEDDLAFAFNNIVDPDEDKTFYVCKCFYEAFTGINYSFDDDGVVEAEQFALRFHDLVDMDVCLDSTDKQAQRVYEMLTLSLQYYLVIPLIDDIKEDLHQMSLVNKQ